LISKAGTTKVDTSSLSIRAGEFVAEEAERLMDQDAVVDAACAEIVALTKDRQCVLIFAAGVSHGQHVQRILQDRYGLECGFVCGETASGERDEILARFRGEAASGLFHAQPLKYLANANLLTTGFDSPRVDCVVLLRPTMSPGLVVQMVGRAFRLHPGKNDALVLDFGGNIQRHGPVDQIKAPHGNRTGSGGEAPAKECPQCHSVIAAGYARCPDCGYEFPEPEWGRHDATASTAGILTGQVTTTVFEVRDEQYSVHRKRGTPADAPRTMRVDYLIGLGTWKSEWVCFEHEGYARKKAEAWWRARADWPVPATAEEAVRLANEGLLRPTKTITVRQVAGDKYDRIIGCSLVTEHQAAAATADSLIPF
jgi:DNA repair protein RadD